MKNVLIKSFVFAIVFTLAGCSNEEQIKVVPDSENQELVLHKNDLIGETEAVVAIACTVHNA